VIRVSAFADEISSDLDEQIEVLQQQHISHLELRSVWDVGVLDLSDSQVETLQSRLYSAGIDVTGIGSPIGKVPVDTSMDEELARLDRALSLCHVLGCHFIRIFSYYPPSRGHPESPSGWRDRVHAKMAQLVARAERTPVTLLHENDTDLYGDSVVRSAEVLDQNRSPHLGAILDPANYLLSHQRPYPDGYEAVRDRLRVIHVKDVRDGAVVPAGLGDADFPELLGRLRDDGFSGILALEPHLAAAGQFRGFSGPERFTEAAEALKRLLAQAGLPWE